MSETTVFQLLMLRVQGRGGRITKEDVANQAKPAAAPVQPLSVAVGERVENVCSNDTFT